MNLYFYRIAYYDELLDDSGETEGIVAGEGFNDAARWLAGWYGEKSIYEMRLDALYNEGYPVMEKGELRPVLVKERWISESNDSN